ncbi:extracellular solute-binding protein [Butyrivibrio fibrisolvens]|uniref:Sugar ABC transporter substrate-binding protein n=1 Tax=Butyrivibrio fibrisolvens TaxID=831 RepID=A0A317FWF2_BUTFI|nr:extracellular solute-binding protein [Butyrivibrio fibrisolvens]PWT26004.1 sugar ABC transporter substrate-binding protein [Butyrivibrio fibrisolvens]
MKKRLLSLLLASSMVVSLAACGKSGEGNGQGTATGSAPADAATELVDGKFADTRTITVEVYDRGNDGGSDPTNNMYTKYIHDQMLEQHNVDVQFVKVPRWTEVDEINNLLAAQTAPDVCVTYSYATIQTYADMGGVLDLSSYVEDYKDVLPNLWDWLGESNIYWDKDPESGSIWALEARLANQNRICTFIRKDWLDTLGLEEPTTKDEFYNVLCQFRDNADKLLGADADKMVPYSVSYDVGWRAATLIESFMDPAITEKEYYVNGFDDRKLTENGTKDAIKLLNKWYNEGLMWDDFAVYGSGDTTEDDMMKAGYVGAFTHNWDYPYRNGEDSIEANLKRLVGEDASYVAIDPFEDSNGTHTKWIAGPIDRKIFFPVTNDEPLASLLYLDFISDPETIQYLQIGDENVTHTVADNGAIQIQAATGDAIQNSGMNIDYTITCNGLHLVDPEITELSLAYSYAGVDPNLILRADEIAKTDTRELGNVQVGAIESEAGFGEALSSKRDQVYDKALSASEADFDSVWDAGMQDYLASGGQTIMDERKTAWENAYGDAENLPEK